MKIKLSQLINSVESLKILQETKLPIKISYRINRLINKLEPELKLFYQKRDDLIKELGEKETENGQEVFKVKEDNMQAFLDKQTELVSEEIEIDWFTPIPLDSLGEISIEPKHIALLSWIFADENIN